MSVEDTMRRVQLEGELQDMRLRAAQLRKFLAGALCATCGEPLGEGEELTQEEVEDDEPKTIHKRCEATEHACAGCGEQIGMEHRLCRACDREQQEDAAMEARRDDERLG